MKPATTRTLVRTLHLLLGVTLGALIYLPTAWIDPLRGVIGFIGVPAAVITGVVLWQQGRLRRLWRRRAARAEA